MVRRHDVVYRVCWTADWSAVHPWRRHTTTTLNPTLISTLQQVQARWPFLYVHMYIPLRPRRTPSVDIEADNQAWIFPILGISCRQLDFVNILCLTQYESIFLILKLKTKKAVILSHINKVSRVSAVKTNNIELGLAISWLCAILLHSHTFPNWEGDYGCYDKQA